MPYIFRVYWPVPLAEKQICHPVAELFYLEDAGSLKFLNLLDFCFEQYDEKVLHYSIFCYFLAVGNMFARWSTTILTPFDHKLSLSVQIFMSLICISLGSGKIIPDQARLTGSERISILNSSFWYSRGTHTFYLTFSFFWQLLENNIPVDRSSLISRQKTWHFPVVRPWFVGRFSEPSGAFFSPIVMQIMKAFPGNDNELLGSVCNDIFFLPCSWWKLSESLDKLVLDLVLWNGNGLGVGLIIFKFPLHIAVSYKNWQKYAE